MKMLRSDEAAEYLGTSRYTLKRWVAAGKVKCHKTEGGQYRFAVEDLDTVRKPPQEGPLPSSLTYNWVPDGEGGWAVHGLDYEMYVGVDIDKPSQYLACVVGSEYHFPRYMKRDDVLAQAERIHLEINLPPRPRWKAVEAN